MATEKLIWLTGFCKQSTYNKTIHEQTIMTKITLDQTFHLSKRKELPLEKLPH